MSYFDAFTANLFRTTKDGSRVIAPFGSLGSTYAVSSDVEARRITGMVRLMYQVMLFAIIGSQILGGWRWSCSIAAMMVVAFYVGMHVLTRSLPRLLLTPGDLAPVSAREMRARAGRAMGSRMLYLMIAGSASFVAIGVWMWSQTRDTTALFPIGFFGLCLATFIYQLIVTRRPPS